MTDKLCSIPGCQTKKYGQLEGQAAIYLYKLDSRGAVEKYAVCAPHYYQALILPEMFETEFEALAQRKEIET